ncbi:MAG: MFS transporter, partial [Ilumatobacteraceae bacterium]
VGSLFAAFLGYNPMKTLVPADTLAKLTTQQSATITGKQFFPRLISDPFIHGLRIAFTASLIMCIVAAIASWMRGEKYVHDDNDDVGPVGAPTGNGADTEAATPDQQEWMPA